MPLIVSSILRRGISPRTGVSPCYLSVDRRYLSSQYALRSLSADYWIYGSILEVSRIHRPLSDTEKKVIEEHVIGRNVKFYLTPGFLIPYDSLYFEEASWSILRDAAIFPDEYMVKVKLFKVEIRGDGEDRVVELYPHRDVEA
ncbi:MAG: hypothetical protein QXE01_06275 [Sulfolobales archaeon]